MKDKPTRSDILRALAEFDKKYPDTNQYENWLDNAAYQYAIRYQGKLYPPKHIFREAVGNRIDELKMSEQLRQVFKDLGFEIIDKDVRDK
ncbi:MAG: hypothetical protein K8I82_16590 [Anaerolineae bacterium]|nr:hypothetical protein [Anaerolineae bacterium]